MSVELNENPIIQMFKKKHQKSSLNATGFFNQKMKK
jgi:hypothetical protein